MGSALDLATAVQHEAVLSWLRSETTCYLSPSLCSTAARQGDMKRLRFLRSLDPPAPWTAYTSTTAVEYTIRQKAKANPDCYQLLHWLQMQDPVCPVDERTCCTAAEEGDLSVLMWLRQQPTPYPWDEEVCIAAVKKGRLDILQWARSQYPPCPWGVRTCAAAVFPTGDKKLAAKRIEILYWLRAQHPPCPWNSVTLCRAVTLGDIGLIRWICNDHLKQIQYLPSGYSFFHPVACTYAARLSNIEILQFLRGLQPPCPWDKGACFDAVKYGERVNLEWLRNQSPPCPWDSSICFYFADRYRDDDDVYSLLRDHFTDASLFVEDISMTDWCFHPEYFEPECYGIPSRYITDDDMDWDYETDRREAQRIERERERPYMSNITAEEEMLPYSGYKYDRISYDIFYKRIL